MAIDYGAGSGRRGAYQNLARALQKKLDADNTRRAEDIRREGLFGTGITQDHLSGLAQTGLAIADFGDKRMQRQMQQAQDSFQRRQDDLFKIAEEHQKAGRYDSAQMAYQQANMERNRFEDNLSKYRDKGLLGSRFGSDTVDYKRDPDAMKGLLQRLEQRNAQKDIKEAARRPRSVRGGRPMAEANRGSAMMPQEDEFGGAGTTPLMSQRMMPERGMEGNPGAQQNRVPTTATMTGEALGPKTYGEHLKTANPMPFPPLNEEGTHDQTMYPTWRDEEEKRQLMKKTKRFYDPAQFTSRY